MASTQSSAIVSQFPITLTLYKYSYATNSTLQAKPVWTHLPQRDNLFIVFDYVNEKELSGVIVKKELLKVIRGGDLLASIDLLDLAHQALRDQERVRSQQIQDTDRRVIIIVKKPLIALRCQLPDGQFRRMQMNFSPEFGYEVAFDVLGRLGIPIRDKNIPPTSQQLFPSASQTIVPKSSLDARKQIASSRPASLILIKDGHTSQAIRGPQCDQQEPGTTFLDPIVSTNSTYPDHLTIAPFRSSSILESAPPSNGRSSSSSTLLPSPALHSRLSVSNSRPETRPSTNKDLVSHQATGGHTIPNASNETTRRPWTAPMSITVETLSQMLPPKRELPFPAPPQKPISRQSKLEGSSLDVLQKLQAPAIRKKIAPKTRAATKRTRAVSKATSSQLSEPPITPDRATKRRKSGFTFIPSTSSELPCLDTAIRSSPPSNARRSRTDLAVIEGEPAESSRKAAHKLKEVESSTSQGELAGGSVNTEWMERVDSFVRRYQNHPAPPLIQPEAPANDLKAYVALPEEQRLAAIDRMIMDCIMDDRFITLCEDVEKSWRRVLLGF